MPSLKIRKPWDWIREPEITPESLYLNRRSFFQRLGLGTAGLGSLLAACAGSRGAASPAEPDHIPAAWAQKWAAVFPPRRNENFRVDQEVTAERLVTSYNNFYEFSTEKERVRTLVGPFEASPWSVEITGQVEKKGKFDLDELIRMGKLEERIYHFRCVEAWSANIPWSGFPLSQLIDSLKPTSRARYLRFVTVFRPQQMPGQANRTYPWPYYEGLTMEEARNELALLTFGLYGHPLNKQNGAPVRLVLPWKFGFKSIKSIVKIEFLERRPGNLWGDISREYGFWANINPRFDHPRWSQARERFLNTGEYIPTRIYNGYGDYVAHLYDENDRRYFY